MMSELLERLRKQKPCIVLSSTDDSRANYGEEPSTLLIDISDLVLIEELFQRVKDLTEMLYNEGFSDKDIERERTFHYWSK